MKLHIYNNDNFPCFVQHGEDIEDPALALNEKVKYRIIARNALRYLTYGKSLSESKVITWDNFKALFIERNALLFTSLRQELQNIFLNIYACVVEKELDQTAEKRVEIFISNLLSAYPFMDPSEDEKICLPQKINNKWELATYNINKIDISPQSGLLSKLIEDEDRLYAYGLTPSTANAQPYLLLEGTTYPSGQGADLNYLYNFKPNTSVGEGHDTTLLEYWIKSHSNIKLAGHSKGATMAMILATRYRDWVSQADCLNPTGLCRSTVVRLNEGMNKTLEKPRTRINIYTQAGDPVFLIDNNFLNNAHFYRIGKMTDRHGSFVAHAHYFSGHKSEPIVEITNLDKEIPSKKREFVSAIKEALNWAMFPLLYIKLCYKLCERKILRFCENHSTLIHLFLFGITLGVCISLIASGVAAPLLTPLVLKFGAPLAYSAVTLITSVVASSILPKASMFVTRAISTLAFAAVSIGTFSTTLSIGAAFSGLNIGIKSLLHGLKSLLRRKIQPSTDFNLQALDKGVLLSNNSTAISMKVFKTEADCSQMKNSYHQEEKAYPPKRWDSKADDNPFSFIDNKNMSPIITPSDSQIINIGYKP